MPRLRRLTTAATATVLAVAAAACSPTTAPATDPSGGPSARPSSSHTEIMSTTPSAGASASPSKTATGFPLTIDTPKLGPLPANYRHKVANGGTLQTFSYSTRNYAGDSAPLDKQAMVYLPPDYGANPTQRYNVVYLVHGITGNQHDWLGTVDKPSILVRVFDHLHSEAGVPPFIVVCPPVLPGEDMWQSTSRNFSKELTADLIPAVESHFRTYAQSTTPADLIAARNHRVMAGFSMGGAITWYALGQAPQYFTYYLPMSADGWFDGMIGSPRKSAHTAEILAQSVREAGLSPTEYFIFAAVGTDDLGYRTVMDMDGLIREMGTLSEQFILSDDGFAHGNLQFYVVDGAQHFYQDAYEYLYNGLRSFFFLP